jgi:hypothetical protein
MKAWQMAVVSMIVLCPTRATAQETCGWFAAGETARLPDNVEKIIAKLPPSWKEAPDAIQKLNEWFHHCDDISGHEAVFAMQRAMRRGISGTALDALLGTALMHGPDVQIDHAIGITNRATYKLSNAERDGARLLAKAAAADPDLTVAAAELVEVAIATRHKVTVDIALNALKDVAKRRPTAELLRMAAELAVVAKDYPLALSYGAKAIQLGDTMAYHAIGLARAYTGADSAAEYYLRGLDARSALPIYYDDLSYLLQPDDTLAWRRLDDTARADWIRRQWEWRAATSSQSLTERLRIHFERIAYATDNYPRISFRAVPGRNAVVTDQRLRLMSVDDRGLIYIRHGAPDEVIHGGGMKAADDTRLAWGYKRLSDGRALFEFTKKDCPENLVNGAQAPGTGKAGERIPLTIAGRNRNAAPCISIGDYYLATPLACTTRGTPTDTYYAYGTSIGPYDPALASFYLYCYKDLTSPGGATVDFKTREAMQREVGIDNGQVALRTESASPPFTAPLDVAFMTYAMRSGKETQLFGFAGLGGGSITPKSNTTDYSLRVQLSVENSRTLSATLVDTVMNFRRAEPLGPGQVVHAAVVTSATPARDATVRLTVRNQNDAVQGQIITSARAIPDFGSASLALSDLVIAETRNGGWVRGNIRLAPMPAHLIEQGKPFRLFYELYGTRNGDSLDVSIVIAPGRIDNILAKISALVSGKDAMSISFAERSAVDEAGTARFVRDIGADVTPGRYIVTVRIRNARTGETAESHTDMVVIKQ